MTMACDAITPKLCAIAGLTCDIEYVMMFIEKHSTRHTYEIISGRSNSHPRYQYIHYMHFSFTMLEPSQEQIDWLRKNCAEVSINTEFVDGCVP